MGRHQRVITPSPIIGTFWTKGDRAIQVTGFYPAPTPLDVHRISWVRVGSRPKTHRVGEMDLATLYESWTIEEEDEL